MRPSLTLASSSVPGSANSTICSSGPTTLPTYCAYRPSRPTFTQPGRDPALEPDIHRAEEAAGRDRAVLARVEQNGTAARVLERDVDRQRGGRLVFMEELMRLAVAVRVVGEVRGRLCLPLGNDEHELVARHRLQRVVRCALFPDGRRQIGGEVLAAR